MLKEFKEFISRGSVIDLAVGIIIGAAFTGIVNSLVNDVVMPVIGYIMSGIDFSNLFLPLDGNWDYKTAKDAKAAGTAVISYGIFINAVVNFVIVSFVIFMVVRSLNKLKKQQAAAPAVNKTEILLEEIRDALKAQKAKKPKSKD